MTDTTSAPPEYIKIPRADFDDLLNALREYQFMAMFSGNAWGQQDARELMTRLESKPPAYMWVNQWFGRNHQAIAAGEHIRRYEAGVQEFHPCEVLKAHTFGALVLDEFGADWHPWHALHRLDRLHSEPTFDVTDYAAIEAHMAGCRWLADQ